MFALSLYTITHKFILSLFAHKGKYKGKKISQQDITECGNRRTVFGKKKEEEKKTPVCACSCGCAASEAESITNDCCPDLKEGEICCIKVLGAGCKSCHEQFEYTKQAVKDMGLSVEVEYITDMQKVMEYGVMSMPALVVNEKVVAMGKVLKAADVVALLHKLGF